MCLDQRPPPWVCLLQDTGVKGHGGAASSIYDNQLSAVNSPIEDSPVGNNVGEESGPQTSGASNGSTISVDMKSRPKRSPLTARETKGCESYQPLHRIKDIKIRDGQESIGCPERK
ncbi:hypothetical protein NC651_019948 [Populus alba x Populus x berolinensis]|nr:hypothetical protein NC651_019948 [Populus alba x Populus x berolinensis]